MSKPANYIAEVREQYEELPYPERDPADEKQRLVASYLGRLDAVNHHCFKGAQDFNDFRVLIAGGGTGDNLILWAEQLRDKKNAEVVYLDLSMASTVIAKKRAANRKLDNIKWINDSLLNIPALDLGPFDFIDCTGVLHHLQDPDAGLKALASVLKPGGAMNLMVYAPYGRAGVYQTQALMRLVNGADTDLRQKIKNTKEMLKCLPKHHWMNIQRQVSGWSFGDLDSNAGLYDLLLHAQDRAYTILEVHEWLERCGLKMTSEPGSQYRQTSYLPETYIKDATLLEQIGEHPLPVQQAIAEATAGNVALHEFYAVHQSAGEATARVTDMHLVPWQGMKPCFAGLDQLATIALQRRESFTVQSDGQPKIGVFIPQGKFVPDILRRIDGQRTVGEIVADILQDPNLQKDPPSEAAVLADFEVLFMALNRGHFLYLRDKSVQPFAGIDEMQKRLRKG